ncbi:MAG: DHHA1 domain-containing protein [Pyrinomonadaceae bacterium]
MNATKRLYYDDSHLTNFQARVLAVTEIKDKGFAVTLDETAFYPMGGGQPSDTGTLECASGTARVVECVDAGEAGVQHVVEGELLQVGEAVTGRIDWSRRFEHIQQHTAQHIFSQAFIKLYEAETHGFRIMKRWSEIDVRLDNPSDERIREAIEMANKIVWENRPIRVRHVSAEEAAHLPLRKTPTREGELRIVEIEGYDTNACGGTHARATGEIGMILVRSWERAKGMTRIEFVAGARALKDYEAANETARRVAALFSVGRDEVEQASLRLIEEGKELARRLRALESTFADSEAETLMGQAMLGRDDLSVVARTFDDRDHEGLKQLAHKLIQRPRTIALLGSTDGDDAARLVFARSPDVSEDMNLLMREACQSLDGRGGGRPDMAQGGGQADSTTLTHILERIAGRFTAN